MCTPATVTTIRSTQCSEFISQKMFITGATMSAAAKNAYLVYKITFLQNCIFTLLQIYLNPQQRLIMKYWLLLFIIPFLSASECGKKKAKADSLPACLQEMISKSTKEEPPTTPLRIDAYTYKDKTVYYVAADCCDFFNMVYDDSCNMICAPDGGITGKGDGQCADFFEEAKLIKTVWEKDKQ